jgi:hypothetical protein
MLLVLSLFFAVTGIAFVAFSQRISLQLHRIHAFIFRSIAGDMIDWDGPFILGFYRKLIFSMGVLLLIGAFAAFNYVVSPLVPGSPRNTATSTLSASNSYQH